MTKIYIWPDDFWCYEEDYEDTNWRSDDFRVVEISNDWNYDQIEEFVYKLNRNVM